MSPQRVNSNNAKIKVTGKVTDEKGEPIIGATIKVRGSSQGTVTDLDGNFNLYISKGDKILISYIGFVTKVVSIEGTGNIDITLAEEQRSLDEVIVVGYGSIKKSDLTSSVSKISSEAIANRPVSNLSEAMQGQLAGVNAQAAEGGLPGQQLTIRIRGINTINGDSSPLYVIDGVPRDNMDDIDPSDISSIQILKDAAATSIYGSRGANGVVLIETKKGKGAKPTITFNTYFGFQTSEKKLDMMNGYEWVAYNMWYRNVQYLKQGGSMSDSMASRSMSYRYPSWWLTTNNFTDWQSKVLHIAPMQDYEASASGNSDMGNIYFSLGYLDQDGIVKYTDYYRYNARLNGTLNIAKNLKFGINASMSTSSQNLASTNEGSGQGKDGPLMNALITSPLASQGTCIRTENNQSGTPVSTYSNRDYGATYIDPLAQMARTTDNTKDTHAQVSTWGEWNILKSLTYKIQLSNNYDGETYEYYQPASVNRSGYMSTGNSYSSRTNDWAIQNTLTFDQTFGRHHLNLLLGQSAEKQRYYIENAAATGWPYETVSTLNMASTPITASTYRYTYTNASAFGRLSYDFMDRYLFTATVRRDGSSRFGGDSKWGTFPSFSAGWKLNQEKFLNGVKWLDLLKIRASYGTSGNDRIGNYQYLSQLGTTYSAYGESKQMGAYSSNIANPDLKWEQTGSFDLGLDFSAFNNRLQMNIDYYNNTTKDLLFELPVPTTTGYDYELTNIGKIRNRGIELDVTSYNLTGKFKWSTNLNLSHNTNKVLELSGITNKIISDMWGYEFITRVGGSVSDIYDFKYNGVLTANDIANKYPTYGSEEEGNTKIVDVNGDGKITNDDRVDVGSALPDLAWGITNHFSYKNFELSILFQGQFGGKVMFVGARHLDRGDSNRSTFSRWLKSYKTDLEKEAMTGDVATYLAEHGLDMSWDGKTQNAFNFAQQKNWYNATYARIKNITLSYTVPKYFLKKTKIQALKAYVSIDNVYTFDKYPGYTPETSSYGNGTTELGLDYSTYPLSRRFTLGFNLTF